MNKIFEYILDNPIDFLSLIISFFALLYSFWNNRLNIRVSCKDIFKFKSNYNNDVQLYDYSFDCVINNNSKSPITITKIKLNGQNAFSGKIRKKGYGIKIYSQLVGHETYSISIPLKLEPYDSIDGMLMFLTKEKLELKFINLLVIYTSRGKSFKLILNLKKML